MSGLRTLNVRSRSTCDGTADEWPRAQHHRCLLANLAAHLTKPARPREWDVGTKTHFGTWTRPGLRRHRPAALLAAVAAALVLAACGGGSAGGGGSSSSTIKEGGVFRMGTASTIDSLNPFIAIQSDAYTTFEYIYPELVQYTPSLKVVENFARSWKTSPDGR